jgi:shikimate dehydrogenase
MHRAAFLFFGIEGSYDLFDVEEATFQVEARKHIEAGLSGFNATIPHKHSAFELCSSRSLEARLVGAANTVRVDCAGELHAHNSDLSGFMHALGLLKNAAGACDLNLKSAIVLGAGGAARACVMGLILSGYESVCVIARRAEQAQDVCAQISGSIKEEGLLLDIKLEACDFSVLPVGKIIDSSLIVNCIPIGLTVDALPAWTEQLFGAAKPQGEPAMHERMFFDTVYKPDLSATPFIDKAKANGFLTCDGLSMLVAQAAYAFQFWTGRLPPYDLLDAAARAEIQSRIAAKCITSK